MKNLFVLPTDKPSRLWINNLLQGKLELSELVLPYNTSKHIYITDDSKIKEGDWFLQTTYEGIFKCSDAKIEYIYFNVDNYEPIAYCKKIILTTDQDLIKDGVQTIDDEFLEWFAKNPSCEEVEVNKLCYGALSGFADAGYKIIIPKEEPDYTALLQPVGTTQETLEQFKKKA